MIWQLMMLMMLMMLMIVFWPVFVICLLGNFVDDILNIIRPKLA